MAIIRPRLNDFHHIPLRQEDIDFAIPFLDEDIPLYVDPFLLWKIPSMQDNALHATVVSAFNQLGALFTRGNETEAVTTLISLTECDEIGLGNSKTKVGKKIGGKAANEILNLFKNIPQVQASGFAHFEEIQLLVDGISKDRISDITCSILKSFLIDYTAQSCEKYHIPMEKVDITVYDYKVQKLVVENIFLPTNPAAKSPILFAPRRWLRFSPWINYEDYFEHHYIKDPANHFADRKNRVEILEYNRYNYDQVSAYVGAKQKNTAECKNDPLFTQIPVSSAKRKVSTILKLPTGKSGNADKQYEDLMVQVLASMLYPHLDFAQEQSRTDSGVQIRDLIFYNNRSFDFLTEIYDGYDSRQLIFELKNVKEVEREHINQLNRYLSDQFGRFGIICTRNPPPRNIFQSTIDLWSGQRRCILILDDIDLELMGSVFESKQRLPIEIVKRKYIEFTRSCPG